MMDPSRALLSALLGVSFLCAAGTARSAPTIIVSAGGREPSISGDGQVVAFSSLVKFTKDDANAISDIYVRDLRAPSLRRISDDRGGDRPMVTADGRSVLYRGLDLYPKQRLVELRGDLPPRTVSHSFNGISERYSENATISPEGQFAAFSLRPIPALNSAQDPVLAVNDTTVADQSGATSGILSGLTLGTVGRIAVTRDGQSAFYETSDALLPANDLNGAQDIYLAHVGNNQVVRLSAADTALDPDTGKPIVPDLGGAHHPAVNATGTMAFFISEHRLHAADPVPLTNLYFSSSATNFQIPTTVPIRGHFRPLALSRQATGTGAYIVFLGANATGSLRPYIVRVSDGVSAQLASSAPALGGEPAISADDSKIAVVEANGRVSVVANPLPFTPAAPPVATLSGIADGALLTENDSVNLTATATSAGSSIYSTAIELDGAILVRLAGPSAQQGGYQFTRGTHVLRALALNDSNVPAESSAITVTVKPAANSLTLSALQHTGGLGQAVSFTGQVRIDNTFATDSNPTQLIVSEVPTDATWEIFGDAGTLPARQEQILAVIDSGPVPHGASVQASISAATLPPEIIGADGFQGIAWTVRVKLQELVAGTWTDRDSLDLLQVVPALNEDTPGPNGGAVVTGTLHSDNTFHGATVTDLAIHGPVAVSEFAKASFTCTASFSSGSAIACTPAWSIAAGGAFAAVTSTGVLVGKVVSAARPVMLRAIFGGKSQTFHVTIRPVSPVVSVVAHLPAVENSGVSGAFRLLRSPLTAGDLTVNYQVGGKAIPGQDYTALTGTAVIPATKSFVDIPVAPINDNNFEGSRSVILTVQPASDQRLGSAHTATLFIADDEATPPRADQPDALIQAAGRPPIGANVYDTFDTTQQASALGIVGRPSVFTASFLNRTSSPETFTVQGAGDFLGFSVRYYNGRTEVTSDVIAGTYQFPNPVPTNAAAQMTVRITPTATTPLGSTVVCPITVTTGSHQDQVEAILRRAR